MGKQIIAIGNLYSEECLLEQYVNLRNQYTEKLLTRPVAIPETKDWLRKNRLEGRCIVEDRILFGVVLLYLDKDGEVTIFVKEQNSGLGSELLKLIDEVAIDLKLDKIWAWVHEQNLAAQRCFEKSGFQVRRYVSRTYEGYINRGIEFEKMLRRGAK